MTTTAFEFLDATRILTLVDHELELVEPAAQHIPDLLAACDHPLTRRDMPVMAKTTRESLQGFLAQNPGGRSQAEIEKDIAPGYTFWMRLRRSPLRDPRLAPASVTIAGSISLRLGHSENLDYYLGHIGYHVLPPARGRHYAERACRLLLPLARAHGQREVTITCNPENAASRRTVEALGGRYLDTVALPPGNALYGQGERFKCRYRLKL